MNIENNTFQDIGSNVIQIGRISNYIGEGHPLHLDYKDEEDAPAFNVVTNNHLKNVATVDKGGVGILIAYSNNNKISHNLIEGAPYTGISVGWRWGNDGLLTNAHHNEISYNHIRNCMEYLGDGGAIKNLWETMTIKNNGCDDCENTLEAIGEIAKYSDFGDNLPPDPSIYGIQNKK